jgi:hypothetical protein
MIGNFAEQIGLIVFDPDYYEGRWYVTFRGRRRVCGNYVGANAWAGYLQRQFGGWALNRIAIGKVLKGEHNDR